MQLFVAGLSHKTAPIEVRERVALTEEELPEALDTLASYCRHGVIVSTCNRTEVYALAEDVEAARDDIQGFLRDRSGLWSHQIVPYVYCHVEAEAVAHLFRVASGIDSMVVGESQILGQVRDSLEQAEAHHELGPVMSNLFRRALRVGKRSRSETRIGEKALSVSAMSVDLARATVGELTSRTVLVISAGEAGVLVAKALVGAGASRLVVTNRTFERAQALAEELGGEAMPFERLVECMAQADVVIASSGAPKRIVGPKQVRQAMRGREERPLMVVDIAVPRDVDPDVRNVRGVHLFNIDDLQQLAEINLGEREREVAKVAAIVESEVEQFMAWRDTLHAVPTIVALRRKAEAIREAELAKAISKLKGVDEETSAVLEAMTRAITNKMLHSPTYHLKHRTNGRGYAEVVRELFELDPEQPEGSDSARR